MGFIGNFTGILRCGHRDFCCFNNNFSQFYNIYFIKKIINTRMLRNRTYTFQNMNQQQYINKKFKDQYKYSILLHASLEMVKGLDFNQLYKLSDKILQLDEIKTHKNYKPTILRLCLAQSYQMNKVTLARDQIVEQMFKIMEKQSSLFIKKQQQKYIAQHPTGSRQLMSKIVSEKYYKKLNTLKRVFLSNDYQIMKKEIGNLYCSKSGHKSENSYKNNIDQLMKVIKDFRGADIHQVYKKYMLQGGPSQVPQPLQPPQSSQLPQLPQPQPQLPQNQLNQEQQQYQEIPKYSIEPQPTQGEIYRYDNYNQTHEDIFNSSSEQARNNRRYQRNFD